MKYINNKQEIGEIIIENKIDKKLTSFIIIFYSIESLNKAIKTIFKLPPMLWEIVSILSFILIFATLLYTFNGVLKRHFKIFIITEVFLILTLAFSYFLGNFEYELYLNQMLYALVISVPLGVYFYCIKDYEYLYRSFYKVSYFLITINSIALISLRDSDVSYSMSISYSLLLPLLFQINHFLVYRRKISLIIALLGGFLILLFGSRAPLLIIGFFVIYGMVLYSDSLVKKVIASLTSLVFIIFISMSYSKIGLMLNDKLNLFGIESRNLNLIKLDILTDNSSREALYSYYIEMISQNPIIGWGIYGGWLGPGEGPHNLIIEVMLAFGIVLGSILLLLLMLMFVNMNFVKNQSLKQLLLIYGSTNLVLFFVMGNFLEKYNLFVFIFLSLKALEKNNKNFKS